MYTWGYNDYGQLGWGLHGKDRTGQQKPKEVALPCDQEEKPPKAPAGLEHGRLEKQCTQ